MASDTPNVPVKATQTMLRVIKALQELDGAGVTELASHLGIAKSTAHNHLATLERSEYIVKEGTTYQLGFRFLDHGGYVRARDSRYAMIKSKIRDIAEETGELCQFAVEEHGRAVFIFRERGEQAVQTRTRVGTRMHLHHVTSGKAIMANLPQEKVKEIIERHGLPQKTEDTITTPEELFADLETIEDRGYAFDRHEHIKGLHAIGVAVTGNDGRALGAISVAGPSHRMKGEENIDEVSNLLLGVANELELNMAYTDVD